MISAGNNLSQKRSLTLRIHRQNDNIPLDFYNKNKKLNLLMMLSTAIVLRCDSLHTKLDFCLFKMIVDYCEDNKKVFVIEFKTIEKNCQISQDFFKYDSLKTVLKTNVYRV